MKIGTRSLVYGGHCWPIHTVMLAIAWTRLYGFPFDPRLWVAFAVHDIGYLGKPNMDGPEGDTHPILGAKIMEWLFGPAWGLFTISHSRFYAARAGVGISKLCVADKLATVLTPNWLYLPLVQLSGEVKEYRNPPPTRYEYAFEEKRQMLTSDRDWVLALKSYMGRQVEILKRSALDISDCRQHLQGRDLPILDALNEQD